MLPDGTEIKGSRELVSYLLENKQAEFAEGFSKHLLTYALGRRVGFADGEFVDMMQTRWKSDGYRMQSLIHAIVSSEEFQTK